MPAAILGRIERASADEGKVAEMEVKAAGIEGMKRRKMESDDSAT